MFGATLSLTFGEAVAFYVPLNGSVLFAVMTVGLACVIRSQVAAVAVPVAWLLLLDSMVGFAAEQFEFSRPVAAIAPYNVSTSWSPAWTRSTSVSERSPAMP